MADEDDYISLGEEDLEDILDDDIISEDDEEEKLIEEDVEDDDKEKDIDEREEEREPIEKISGSLVLKPGETIREFIRGSKDNSHRDIHVITGISRTSSHILQQLEMTEIVGIRASQIEHEGVSPFVEYEGLDDPIEIAKKELREQKIPFKLLRIMNKTPTVMYVEEWSLSEMLP